VIIKLLFMALVAVGGLFLFQWILYTAIYDFYKTRTIAFAIPGLFSFSWAFQSHLVLYFVVSCIVSVCMLVPNAFGYWVAAKVYHELLNKAWILYLIFVVVSVSCTATIFWIKFAELPTKGTLIGLVLYFLGASISFIWK
jgi:hypothetical protein